MKYCEWLTFNKCQGWKNLRIAAGQGTKQATRLVRLDIAPCCRKWTARTPYCKRTPYADRLLWQLTGMMSLRPGKLFNRISYSSQPDSNKTKFHTVFDIKHYVETKIILLKLKQKLSFRDCYRLEIKLILLDLNYTQCLFFLLKINHRFEPFIDLMVSRVKNSFISKH